MNARDVRDGRAREASAARRLARMRRTHAGRVLRTLVDAWRGERPLVAHHRRARRTMLRRVLRAVDAASREGPRTSPGRRCAMIEATARDFAPVVRCGGRSLCAPWPDEAKLDGRWLRARPPRFFVGGGAAAGRPPLRRCSGDVVTAGMISSRVWFGPVPGSP
ncbi:hypothetical protein F511_20793 [Dorcoceras hygrometricum]|uniref:Uncharacterized protein n=1 Tax=Dorcoceras hygrometricum TaxID=472368 RepID=A0A2Z7BQR2_9LAMI|nr:hypothetical protein F511_20793 [Dorcoceras hygrometricum]